MIKLYSPSDETELALIISILEGDRIPFFIHNDHFGSLRVGPPIDLFNKKTIMVNKEYEERARELLSDFFKETKEEKEYKTEYSFFDKLRVIAEFLLFAWFVPGKRRKTVIEEKKKT